MKTENPNTPIFGTPEEARVAPKFEMPKTSMPGEVAYQLVHDEAMMDGNARLNLATFVTTWMDDYARRVMTENMDKNMIDKTEYPQTAEIERRCVNIIAKLWHSPEPPYCTGTSTVGSSEACMLGGIAALKRWQKRRRAKGLPTNKPNFIISTCMQVVWEKFAIYWDVEMRMVPVTMEKITMDPQDVVGMCDENTICVVPIQGVTITGLNDNVKEINDALDKLNAEKGRVANIVYGYDKTIGDYFNLEINKEEARIVRQIYKWYINEGYGAAKIANMLNEQGIKTKRNCAWSQNAICRILTNELYMEIGRAHV